MDDRDQVETILYARYAGAPVADKRLDDMLAGLCSRYPNYAWAIREQFDQMLSNRPAWWHHDPLFHVHVCCHIEQRFAHAEGLRLWLRHQSEQAWMQFLTQRRRDNALLRSNSEFAMSVMRDNPDARWNRPAFKVDIEGDAA